MPTEIEKAEAALPPATRSALPRHRPGMLMLTAMLALACSGALSGIEDRPAPRRAYKIEDFPWTPPPPKPRQKTAADLAAIARAEERRKRKAERKERERQRGPNPQAE